MDPARPLARPLAPSDAPALHRLIQAAFAEQDQRLDPPQSALRETTDSLAAHIAATGGRAVAWRGDLAAAVLWREEAGGLYLSRLAVAPWARRQGFARQLLAAAADEARTRGLGCLRLSTRLALTSNRALFSACGFVETAERAHPGFGHPTFVELERLL